MFANNLTLSNIRKHVVTVFWPIFNQIYSYIHELVLPPHFFKRFPSLSPFLRFFNEGLQKLFCPSTFPLIWFHDPCSRLSCCKVKELISRSLFNHFCKDLILKLFKGEAKSFLPILFLFLNSTGAAPFPADVWAALSEETCNGFTIRIELKLCLDYTSGCQGGIATRTRPSSAAVRKAPNV